MVLPVDSDPAYEELLAATSRPGAGPELPDPVPGSIVVHHQEVVIRGVDPLRKALRDLSASESTDSSSFQMPILT